MAYKQAQYRHLLVLFFDTRSWYVAERDLKLAVTLLPLPLNCWDCRCLPQSPAQHRNLEEIIHLQTSRSVLLLLLLFKQCGEF